MRLIDADELVKQGYELVVDGLQYITCNKSIDIDDIPTAYDIGKVVSELKQQAEQYGHRAFEAEEKGLSALADKYYGKYCSYDNAIEIVKQGGVGKVAE